MPVPAMNTAWGRMTAQGLYTCWYASRAMVAPEVTVNTISPITIDQDPDHAEAVIYRLEDGIAQARAVARIVHESVVAAEEWDPEFRRRWTDVLERVGQRVADPGRDTGGAPGLDDLVHDLSVADLPDRRWPLYGALITALDNVAGIADDVARLSGAAGWETA